MTDGFADPATPALPLHAVTPDGLEALLGALPASQSGRLRSIGCAAHSNCVR